MKANVCFQAWFAESLQVKSCPQTQLKMTDEARNEDCRHPDCEGVWSGTDLPTYQMNMPPLTTVHLLKF